MQQYLTRNQAAKLAGVGLTTLDKAAKSGALPCAHEGYTPLFKEEDVLRWRAKWEREQSGIYENGSLFGGAAAARYLGMTKQGFYWHRDNDPLAPDIVRGKREFYRKSTLDAIKRKQKK